MTTFQFTLWGCALCFLLFVAALVTLYALRVPVWKKALKAFVRMAAGLALVGLLVYSAYRINHWAYSLLMAVLMAICVAAATMCKARIREWRYLLPIALGMGVCVIPLGLFFLFFTLAVPHPLDAQVLVPVWGMMLGAMVDTDGAALAAYYDGLRHHARLYHYLVGNGATHAEAVAGFFRRALHRSVSPWVRRMGMMAVGTVPLSLWVLLLCGVGIVRSVVFCLLVASLLFSTAIASIVATLLLARRFSFDAYERIKSEVK